MWILFARAPLPDAPYWPGRRWLAVVDAVLWPLAWGLLFRHTPEPTGVAGLFVATTAFLYALSRLHRALWRNNRYQFATWRWGRIAAILLVGGAVLKLSLPT